MVYWTEEKKSYILGASIFLLKSDKLSDILIGVKGIITLEEMDYVSCDDIFKLLSREE